MITITDIQRRVAQHFGLPFDAMRSPARPHRIAHPRQTAMYLARELTTASWPQIGRRFCRDHTTIMHGVRAVEERLRTDEELRRRVEWLRFDLGLRA